MQCDLLPAEVQRLKMKKVIPETFAIILLLALSSGCTLFDFDPQGKAPDGAIVNNQLPESFNSTTAVNYMTTALSIYLLQNPLPEKSISIDADAHTRPFAAQVLTDIEQLAGYSTSAVPGKQRLQTRQKNGHWHYSLVVNGKTVWEEQLKLSICR